MKEEGGREGGGMGYLYVFEGTSYGTGEWMGGRAVYQKYKGYLCKPSSTSLFQLPIPILNHLPLYPNQHTLWQDEGGAVVIKSEQKTRNPKV